MTAPEPTMSCPTDEALASFIDNRLDDAERRRMIEHLSTCGECRSVVHTAAEYEAEEGSAGSGSGGRLVRFMRRTPLSAVAAIAVAATVVVVLGPTIRDRWFPPGIESLVAASRNERYRPTQARLSGDFPYREAKEHMRGPKSDSELGHADLFAAAVQIERIANAYPTAENLHALGVAYVLVEQPQQAWTALEDALRNSTHEPNPTLAIEKCTDPGLLNDLAAVSVERNEKVASLAVPAAERAWTLRKNPRIGWTRAIAIEMLENQNDRAIQAWRDDLAIETDPMWRAEAQRRLEKLSEPEEGEHGAPNTEHGTRNDEG
jgi:Putative zinc-finger